MTDPADDLSSVCLSAFESYLQEGGETGLSRAYEVGRRALSEGLGVLDIAALFRDALDAVLSAPDTQRESVAAAAGEFFRELLSPFEMTLRGYRDANRELNRLNTDLIRQKEATEAANRELESFSYSVAHDLRAPLRSIDGFNRILLDEYGGRMDDHGLKYLRRVQESTRRMSQLIEGLLSLARLTRSEMRTERVDLSALVRRIAKRMQSEYPDRQAEFLIADGVVADGDERLLGVVFENLLGNAWKFTAKRAQACIEFCRRTEAGRIVYVVRDNGAGFDMKYAGKLFGTFQRLHSVSEFDGTGIGLATVQRIVHRHGGDIWALGEVDHGASFFFTLAKADSR